MDDRVTELAHPSYVAVSFSRCSGNPQLFGSSLDTHYGYMMLRVSAATLIRDGSTDRISSSL